MQIYLVRHGESEANLTRTIQGTLDSPLTELGRQQAKILANHLPQFDKVFTSPLIRAKETGLLATGIKEEAVTIDLRLSEIHFGDLQGQPYADFPAPHEVVRAHVEFTKDALMGKYNAELVVDFLKRTHNAFEDIVADAESSNAEKIAVFSHGGVLRSIEQHYLELGNEKWQNCEYGVLSRNGKKWELVRFKLPNIE